MLKLDGKKRKELTEKRRLDRISKKQNQIKELEQKDINTIFDTQIKSCNNINENSNIEDITIFNKLLIKNNPNYSLDKNLFKLVIKDLLIFRQEFDINIKMMDDLVFVLKLSKSLLNGYGTDKESKEKIVKLRLLDLSKKGLIEQLYQNLESKGKYIDDLKKYLTGKITTEDKIYEDLYGFGKLHQYYELTHDFYNDSKIEDPFDIGNENYFNFRLDLLNGVLKEFKSKFNKNITNIKEKYEFIDLSNFEKNVKEYINTFQKSLKERDIHNVGGLIYKSNYNISSLEERLLVESKFISNELLKEGENKHISYFDSNCHYSNDIKIYLDSNMSKSLKFVQDIIYKK